MSIKRFTLIAQSVILAIAIVGCGTFKPTVQIPVATVQVPVPTVQVPVPTVTDPVTVLQNNGYSLYQMRNSPDTCEIGYYIEQPETCRVFEKKGSDAYIAIGDHGTIVFQLIIIPGTDATYKNWLLIIEKIYGSSDISNWINAQESSLKQLKEQDATIDGYSIQEKEYIAQNHGAIVNIKITLNPNKGLLPSLP